MKLATVAHGERWAVAVVDGHEAVVLPVEDAALGAGSMRAVAGGGAAMLERIGTWAASAPADARRPLDALALGPAVPDPGAIYTIGHNYRGASEPDGPPPERPLVYGKATSSVGGDRASLSWDRDVTDNVDAEVELGAIIGRETHRIAVEEATAHVFGYTCVNDVSSRDAWLDGDQWLIGKSLPGFCPLGPWIVTADELDPSDLRLTCTINGAPIQDGRTSRMRTSIPAVVSYLSRHLTLRPGDVVVTGTPERLAEPPGPDRRLRAGDEVTVSIEGIGDLTTFIR